MPRPKPQEPLKSTSIRLTEKHTTIFKQLGGTEWLRKMLDKHRPLPNRYYGVEIKHARHPDAAFLARKQVEEND